MSYYFTIIQKGAHFGPLFIIQLKLDRLNHFFVKENLLKWQKKKNSYYLYASNSDSLDELIHDKELINFISLNGGSKKKILYVFFQFLISIFIVEIFKDSFQTYFPYFKF